MVKYILAAIGCIVAFSFPVLAAFVLINEAIRYAPCNVFMAVCLMLPAALFAGAIGFLLRMSLLYAPMTVAGVAGYALLKCVQCAQLLETTNAQKFGLLSFIAAGVSAAAYDFARKHQD